jgi:hypothetical protein
MRLLTLLTAALLLASACTDPAARPPSNAIWPRFDPSTGDIPSPSDLVRDPDAGKLDVPITPGLNPAEAEFRAYLNTLDGFPTSTPALVHFSGAIAPDSITEQSLLVWKLDAHGVPTSLALAPTYSDAEKSLTLLPKGGWDRGTTYVVALRGGTKGLKGATGEPVVAAPAFYFLRAGKDLSQHPWALPGDTLADKQASADQLEAVRQGIEPMLQSVVTTEHWTREEIAVLFSFTTTKHNALEFDPLSGVIPLPNDLLLDPTTHLVSVPADPADTPAQAVLKASLNTLDGFSTTGILAAQTTAPIDAANAATPRSIRLFELSTPPTEVTGLRRYLYRDNQHVFAAIRADGFDDSGNHVAPTVLKPKTTYAWVVTGQRGTDGAPVDAQPVGALLRLKASLVKDGKSQVSGIADADAQRLEPLRAKMVPLLDLLATQAAPRESIEAAVPFTTVDVRGHAVELAQEPFKQNLSVVPTDHFTESRDNFTDLFNLGGAWTAMPNVDHIVGGHFLTYDKLDPVTQAFSPNGTGTARPINFTMTLPHLSNGQKAKVILFGHGLTTERRLGWFEAERLAQAGFAVFSFDLPYHGERSSCHIHLPICSVLKGIGLDSSQLGITCNDSDPRLLCASGVCNADGTCGGGDGDARRYNLYNYGTLVDPQQPGTPLSSGGAFVNLEDLGASRDHFRQAIIDLSAAYRFLETANWPAILPDGVALDLSDVRYTGISLGGILGGVGAGTLPPVRVLALNVGGAGLVDLFQESVTFGTILPPGLASQGITLNTTDPTQNDLGGWQFLTAAHWVLDDIDPINIARFAMEDTQATPDPVTGQSTRWPQKQVLLQMAGADTIVSNPSTYRLRYTLDPGCCDKTTASCSDTDRCVFNVYPGASHIFEVNPLELLNEVPGQNEVADFLKNRP